MTVSSRDLRSVLLRPDASLRQTYRAIEAGRMAIALVVDKNHRLLGTVTDGDIRRGLLRGIMLDDRVDKIMKKNPVTAVLGTPPDELLVLMQRHSVQQIPLMDKGQIVRGVELVSNLLKARVVRTNPVVIFAGGFGRRLQPMTLKTPKPMLPVGGRPLLEQNIRRMAAQGFDNFFISVFYRQEVIRRILGDGKGLGVRIRYVDEPIPMGTAGSLRLMGDYLGETFLAINGDVLTSVNFDHMMEYHRTGGQRMTVAIKEHSVQIPYGVIRLEGEEVISLEEKPLHTSFVNAGMYVIEPGLLRFIPKKGSCDMPDLIRSVIAAGNVVKGFPVHEYWVDIGTPRDYSKANQTFNFRHKGGR